MRVLHLCAAGYTGGIEVLLRNYAGLSVHDNYFIFVWNGGEIADEMREVGEYVEILHYRDNGFFTCLHRVLKIISQEKIDVVISHHAAPAIKAILLIAKMRYPKIKIVTYAHADVRHAKSTKKLSVRILLKRKINRFLQRAAYQKADSCIAISEFVKKSVSEAMGTPNDKTVVIYNGTPLPEVSERIRKHDVAELIYVGRLEAVKGVQNVLRALAMLPSGMEYRFTVVGDGSLRSSLEKLTQQLGLEERVRFLGTRRDVFELLAQSDIFVHLPSWEEGFGITVVEAMAAGCVCICGAKGGIPEIIRDGVDGYLIKSREAEELAETLTDMIPRYRAGEYEGIRQKSILRARDFSIEKYSRELDSYLRALHGK